MIVHEIEKNHQFLNNSRVNKENGDTPLGDSMAAQLRFNMSPHRSLRTLAHKKKPPAWVRAARCQTLFQTWSLRPGQSLSLALASGIALNSAAEWNSPCSQRLSPCEPARSNWYPDSLYRCKTTPTCRFVPRVFQNAGVVRYVCGTTPFRCC